MHSTVHSFRTPEGVTLGVDRCRRAGVAQVVAHDVTSTASERLAERVGPGEHRRPARE